MNTATQIEALAQQTGVSAETVENLAQHVANLLKEHGITEQDMIEAGEEISAAYLMATMKQRRQMATCATMAPQKFAESVLPLI